MRVFISLMILQVVFASLLPAVSAMGSEISSNSHQNKKSALVSINGGKITKYSEESKDRTFLTEEVFEINPKKLTALEKHNQKRLGHYEHKLEGYNPPQSELTILVTGYSSTPDQTWGNPFITASGTRVHKGTLACPPQYPFGTKVQIEGRGSYICEDRGGAIKGDHFDMWFESRKEALQWGKRRVVATIVK